MPRRNSRITVLVGSAAILAAALAASATSLKKIKPGAPSYAAFKKPLSRDEKIQHALERLTFGPRPGDLEALKRTGLRQWLDAQLNSERSPENALLEQHLAPFNALRMSADQLAENFAPLRKAAKSGDSDSDDESNGDLSAILTSAQIDVLESGTPVEKRQLLAAIPAEKRSDFINALRPAQRRRLLPLAPVELRREMMLSVNPPAVLDMDLSEAKLLRALYSDHQLQELLVDFWYNHFNVFLDKGADRYLVSGYERDAIRPYVFGKFYDLLLATAKSPAMLFYLDNWQSVGPNSVAERLRPNAKKRGLNENYGRELMELHTLGVDGGYTQRDVIEVARCFTGWTIAAPKKGGAFKYNDRMHDKGEKVVLGHLIPAGGGMDDGLEVLNILATAPATAHHISLELAQRFVADDPPPSLVNRMAATFQKTHGDLRQMMRTMISSPEFWSQGAYRAKVKSPFEMVVSALRATNADVTSAFALVNELRKLGEPLYGKLEPNGYSSANAEWVSSSGLLDRMNFALALAANRVPGVTVDLSQAHPGESPTELARSLLNEDPSEQTEAAIENAVKNQFANARRGAAPRESSLIAGLVIGSPEFQRH